MKIGVCAMPDKLPLLSELGFDYYEPKFSWLASLDKAEFREQAAALEKYSLAPEVLNLFFKTGTQLYALDGNQDPLLREVAAYADVGFARASALGGKTVVIGSGSVRGIQEGMTREETEKQFARVLSVCGEAADKHGMTVTIEPLSFNECNYIHTVGEGAATAKLSGHPAVGVMVDFYHHWNNHEDFATLPKFADKLWHAHYARPEDRNAPDTNDLSHLQVCADVLKKCPNAKRISLECRWSPDFVTALTTARPLMEIFKSL